MKVHRLRLTNVRGVAERDLSLPERGVIVVEGPNEVGKSTMVDALDLLLEEKDSSRKRHLVGIRPVGRDVPSAVEAEISSGPYRFRYRKQWFRSPATELHILEPSREQLIGVPAHERVRAILAETADLTLWKALRVLQHAPLQQAELSGSAALSAALDVAGGPGADGPGADGPQPDAEADTLMALAETEFLRYFTAGRAQPTGEYRAALERADAAAEALRAAEAAVQEVADDVARHEVVVAGQARAGEDLTAARDSLAEQERAWAAVDGLRAQRQAVEREADSATRERDRARQRLSERERAVADLATRREALEAHTETLRRLGEDVGPAERSLATLRDQATEAEARVAAALAELDRCSAALARVRARRDADALRARLERAEAADAERRAAAAELALLTVDQAAVRRIDAAATALDLAVARRDADSAGVSLEGLATGTVVVVDGVEVSLAEGAVRHVPVLEPVTIDLPGILRVRVHPESGAAERERAVTSAREVLTGLLQSHGVDSPEQAHGLADRRRRAADALARAEDRLGDVLLGAGLEGLRDQAAAAEARSAGEECPDGGDDGTRGGVDPPDLEALEGTLSAVRAKAETERDRARAEAAALQARVEAAREAAESSRMEQARAASLAEAVGRETALAEARLAEARGLDSDDDLQAAAGAAQTALDDARRQLAELDRQLGAHDEDSVRALLTGAQARVAAGERQGAQLREERIAIEARLEQSGRQGRYDQLEAARGQDEHARRRLTAVRRRAEAARLLWTTLDTHRAEAKAAYVAPFTEAIHRLGRVVYGPDFAVEVADDLTIGARIIGEERIDYDALSTGAKEQLAILTRLAAASIVDPRFGVPVVIDDALGYSDPDRLRRISAAFSLLGRECQVLLLTCTPGRYAGIAGAEVVRV